jgi:hypothetical protein
MFGASTAIENCIGSNYGTGFGRIFIEKNQFGAFLKDTIDLEANISAYTIIKDNSFLAVGAGYKAIKARPSRGHTVAWNTYNFADADFFQETGTAGTVANSVQNNGRLANDANVVLTAAHGSGAWDGLLPAQSVRDAMKLAPSAGAAAAGSIDELALRIIMQAFGRLEFDIPNSKAYIWSIGGAARAYQATLSDKDGNPVTALTSGPINMSEWTVYTP